MAERRKLCLAAVVQFVTFVVALDLARQCGGAASSSSSPDAKAMWDLARALSGLPSSWKSGSDPCDPEWEGVACSAGRVSGINLVSRGVSGTLPASLSTLTSLASLRLHRNRLSGPLPLLPNLSSLQTLFLDGNAFDSLPDTFFAGLSALQEISLDDLPLAPWSISHNLSAAVGLTDFSASNSSLSGTLPDFLGSLLNLRVLRLSYNQLTGSIPSSLAGSGIQQLLLNNQQARDKLSGSIDVLGAMPQLTMIWLQSNSFTGPIPDLSNLTALESFNVRDNALTGIVPPSLTACLTLNNATLSNNLLQGPFPQFASKSATLDVGTGNQFCTSAAAPGPCDPRVSALLAVAEGFGYPAVLAKSWKGNEPCGANWLGVTCDAQKSVAVLNFASQHFGGVISPAFANFTSLRQLLLSNNDLTGSIPDSLTQLPQLQVLDVTNNNLSGKVPAFSSSVTLKQDGNPKLGTDSGSSDESSSGMFGSSPGQFGGSKSGGMIAGIVVATMVLVGCLAALFLHRRKKKQEEKLGHVPTGAPPNEPELINIGSNRMNVNGRGLDPLHTQSGADSASAYSRNEPPLTWKQRLTIVLDVARGIEYLHSLAQESFIHRDLKPSNILLDKDLRAKVSDFGLVKLAGDNQKSMMTRLAGTFGYLAPEYAITGKVSTKIDVYAFGVILMELITGRKVLDESLPPEECHLVAIFRRGISHEKNAFLNAMVDQVLELDEEDQQSLAEVADLAWHCTGREPYQRPDMSHAVNRLSPLVDQWKPTTNCTDEDDGDDSSMSLTQRLERWQHDNTNSATDSFGFTFK
ncbi:hypothetical protein OPV22_016581 [Ensete ventricosum]|uniref:Protein kinase domain-containing protein n=1 Tax=Ensete ventricosum TaxID=4639 RepID=A0AAV8QR29_ENSVE|nr:hypothetical protein OPV22_016581 [Ensete ventricosum]